MIRDPNWWRTIFFNLGKKPTNHKRITRNFTSSNWQWISVATFSSWSIFQSYLFDHFAFRKFWGTAGWWLVSHTHWKTHLWILEFHSNIWPTLNLGSGEPGNRGTPICRAHSIQFPSLIPEVINKAIENTLDVEQRIAVAIGPFHIPFPPDALEQWAKPWLFAAN